jgi:hypothetical protein
MIPKRIHYCWLSGDPFPELIARCVASWKSNLPDYEFVLWDRQRFNVDSIPWVREAFEARKYAFAADFIRLYALHTEGGIYLDADVEILGSFDPLLDQPSFIGYETSGDLEPAVIGAEKGTAWLAACLEHYHGRHFVLEDGSRDTTPLPLIVQRALERLGRMPATTPAATMVAGQGVNFYPADYFSPKDVHGRGVAITARTVAIHHFDGQWVERTRAHAFKQGIHRSLNRLLGARNHRRVVEALRTLRALTK